MFRVDRVTTIDVTTFERQPRVAQLDWIYTTMLATQMLESYN